MSEQPRDRQGRWAEINRQREARKAERQGQRAERQSKVDKWRTARDAAKRR